MARLARVVVPGMPHHITQRGNRRQTTFFCDEDYSAYLELMGQWCKEHGVEIWAYALMQNHVHMIAVPKSEDGLRRAIGEAHRRYTRRVNFREGWRGHLWQGRFTSNVMDENYLLAAVRYVERNPVVAGFESSPGDYPWSSAGHYLGRRIDALIQQSPLGDLVEDWSAFLASDVDAENRTAITRAERSGRPLGAENFIVGLEKMLGRRLQKQKPGPKPKVIK